MADKKEKDLFEGEIDRSKWAIIPKERNYDKENRERCLKNFEKCDKRNHPLSTIHSEKIENASKANFNENVTVTTENEFEKKESKEEEIEFDPLRAMALGIEDDPLSGNSSNINKVTSHEEGILSNLGINDGKSGSRRDHSGDVFVSWKEKRGSILSKYTTSSRLAVTANFLDESDQKVAESEEEQIKKRVEQLEQGNAEDDGHSDLMSQTEYIRRMEHNVQKLRKAWTDGKRVLSLKIAIQSCKLLSESNVLACPQFYPSMFVLIADILDNFGDLVFQRLKLKATDPSIDGKNDDNDNDDTTGNGTSTTDDGNNNNNSNENENDKGGKRRVLRDNFTYIDVSTEARETCQNWFYKIACIRELLPRLFIELSLFKCWRFIRPIEDFPAIMKRLSTMIRGIGDPLVAGYARAYIVHRAFDDALKDQREEIRPIILETFDDFLFCFNDIDKHNFDNIAVVKQEKISKGDYIDLFNPCLDWILQCIAYQASEDDFFALLQRYKDGWNNSIILLHILSHFRDEYLSNRAKLVCRLIKNSFVTTVSRSKLYKELGMAIVNIAPPNDIRLSILNDIWKVVSKMSIASEYVEVASVFIEYILQHFGKKELDILLSDVIKHLNKDLAFEHLQNEIFVIVSHIIKYLGNDFKELFMIGNFLPLIDMLDSTLKMSACKMLLESFRRHCDQYNTVGISDAVLISSLMDVSRMLHDSVDYLTFEDEKRQVTELICHVIDYIDYGHDLERQLNEYIESRSVFGNLDGVIYQLIIKVGDLAMKAHRFMNGKHNKKTGAFVKACIAYCHITIPSLDAIWPRMYLFASMGRIALVNGMIVQAEALLYAAISLIPKLPSTFTSVQYSNTIQSTQNLLVEYLENLCSTLLLLPGHPKKGAFYLVVELQNGLNKWDPWGPEKTSIEKTRALIAIFRLYVALSQKKFAYKLDGVSSNDDMYGQAPSYMNELYQNINELGREIHKQILELKNTGRHLDAQACGMVSLDYINVCVDLVELEIRSVNIIIDLHQIALKSPNLDKKYYNNTMTHIQNQHQSLYNKLKSKEEEILDQ